MLRHGERVLVEFCLAGRGAHRERPWRDPNEIVSQGTGRRSARCDDSRNKKSDAQRESHRRPKLNDHGKQSFEWSRY